MAKAKAFGLPVQDMFLLNLLHLEYQHSYAVIANSFRRATEFIYFDFQMFVHQSGFAIDLPSQSSPFLFQVSDCEHYFGYQVPNLEVLLISMPELLTTDKLGPKNFNGLHRDELREVTLWFNFTITS